MKSTKYSALFIRFWQAYPRKKGKGEAYESFQRLDVEEDDMDTLLLAVKRQAGAYRRDHDNMQYFPYPATWLNQSRWEDEAEAGPKDCIDCGAVWIEGCGHKHDGHGKYKCPACRGVKLKVG